MPKAGSTNSVEGAWYHVINLRDYPQEIVASRNGASNANINIEYLSAGLNYFINDFDNNSSDNVFTIQAIYTILPL